MSSSQNNYNTISLFDVDDDCSCVSSSGTKLEVVKLNYESAESVTWQDLFSGFDSLYAITFSSGVNFVYKLLGMFDYAEIIFGCETVMSYTLQEVMAYQDKLIERMRDNISESQSQLLSRMDNGSVKFYRKRRNSQARELPQTNRRRAF